MPLPVFLDQILGLIPWSLPERLFLQGLTVKKEERLYPQEILTNILLSD